MEEITQRLMRFNRLIAADAHRMLSESPSMLSDLEAALSSGEPLPPIIGVSQLLEVTGQVNRGRSSVTDPSTTSATKPITTATLQLAPLKGPSPQSIDPLKRIKDPVVPPPYSTVRPGDDPPPTEPLERPFPYHFPEPSGSRPIFPPVERVREDIRGAFRPRAPAADEEGDLRIIMDPSVRIGSTGKVDDFRNLFLDRYRSLRELMVKQNPDLLPISDINDLYGSEEPMTFIGMVSDSRTTKNGHQMLLLEDPTGAVRALISKNKDVFKVKLVNDEVIAVNGKYKRGDNRGGGIVFADKVVRVDVPQFHRRRASSTKGLLAAFTSDTHVGSRMYLQEDWERMVSWLRGERDASLPAEMGRMVKYLVISGDLVDGIGVYPEQEKDLQIMDISKQYEALAGSLSRLPDHIELVLMPGNHDAVRLAEPQPPLPKEYQDLFSNSRVHFLSNPTHFTLSGVLVSAYHGRSLDDMVTLFKHVTYECPIQGMKEMLRMRHFSPCYGMRNQLSPEETDMLVLGEVPDILVSGHVHRFEMDVYRGVQMVQGSTWQSQTPFQKMHNFNPEPAKLILVHLGNGSTHMEDFSA